MPRGKPPQATGPVNRSLSVSAAALPGIMPRVWWVPGICLLTRLLECKSALNRKFARMTLKIPCGPKCLCISLHLCGQPSVSKSVLVAVSGTHRALTLSRRGQQETGQQQFWPGRSTVAREHEFRTESILWCPCFSQYILARKSPQGGALHILREFPKTSGLN